MIIKNHGGRLMETNSTIFYTTAQVTEMVELSDQNVRKYVRLLEDRNYEVAKDEHNRRLFSGDDVAILKELIILAKQPGYTLETAADQLANSEVNNVVNTQSRVPAVTSSNEFAELLTSVVERMDDMRHEQKELQEKMDLLISKLEQTSSTFEKSMITHKENEEDTENEVKTETVSEEAEAKPANAPVAENAEDAAGDVKVEESEEQAVEETAKESTEETTDVNTAEPKTEDVNETKEESQENSDESQMFEAEKRQNEKRIDMTTYESSTPEQKSQEETTKEEKGAFGRFLDFLKGK